MDVRDAWDTSDVMIPHTTASLVFASTLWTSQPRGLAKAVLQVCLEITTGTIISRVSASGQRPDPEQRDLAQALTLAQDADGPQQIQLPACPAPQQPANLERVTRKPQRLTPTRKAATRCRTTSHIQLWMWLVLGGHKHEVQTGILAFGALGVLLALVLRMPQTGATSMWVACYAPYAVAKKPPFAESFARLTYGGGTHLPQPCGARLSSVVCARQFLT